MARILFISLPVADVAASTAFYEAVGFHKDESFATGAEASAMRWSDDVVIMLCHRDRFAAQAPRPVANSRAESAVLFALALDSREAVDAVVTRAVAAGGTEGHPPEDLGFMYSRAFDDPDGHSFGPLWMNMEAMPGPDAG